MEDVGEVCRSPLLICREFRGFMVFHEGAFLVVHEWFHRVSLGVWGFLAKGLKFFNLRRLSLLKVLDGSGI